MNTPFHCRTSATSQYHLHTRAARSDRQAGPVGGQHLQAAATAGITLPSSCPQGPCGTCTAVLVSGEVDMQHAGGIRPKEIAGGRFLPCCSVPLSALVVDRI